MQAIQRVFVSLKIIWVETNFKKLRISAFVLVFETSFLRRVPKSLGLKTEHVSYSVFIVNLSL